MTRVEARKIALAVEASMSVMGEKGWLAFQDADAWVEGGEVYPTHEQGLENLVDVIMEASK